MHSLLEDENERDLASLHVWVDSIGCFIEEPMRVDPDRLTQPSRLQRQIDNREVVFLLLNNNRRQGELLEPVIAVALMKDLDLLRVLDDSELQFLPGAVQDGGLLELADLLFHLFSVVEGPKNFDNADGEAAQALDSLFHPLVDLISSSISLNLG